MLELRLEYIHTGGLLHRGTNCLDFTSVQVIELHRRGPFRYSGSMVAELQCKGPADHAATIFQ